jgi:hypothetical protein
MANNILQVKYYNIETGKEIPMSQGEEAKQKTRWQKFWNWVLGGLIGSGGAVIIGIFVGIGSGGGPFEVKRVVITAVDRPGTNI